MNILHMKYALEVARVGSLSKASESLLIATPNISRSIKELEADLGIVIFERTTKGMELTPEGEEFIGYAKEIISQIEQVEKFYKKGRPRKQKFSASVPRACYISEAFAEFTKKLSKDSAEIFYRETNSQRTLNSVTNNEFMLGIVRYPENYDKYYKSMFEDKGLVYELLSEFTYSLIMSNESELAQKDEITYKELSDYIEVAHAESDLTAFPLSKSSKEERPDNIERKIIIFERSSQFDLISKNKETFMWVSPAPEAMLERYKLTQKKCVDNQKVYKDVLIYKDGYKLTELDRAFITSLCEAKRKYI